MLGSRLPPPPGILCTLRGHIIGRGEAGLVWSDDLTFRDDTGLVVIDHRQPLSIWEFHDCHCCVLLQGH